MWKSNDEVRELRQREAKTPVSYIIERDKQKRTAWNQLLSALLKERDQSDWQRAIELYSLSHLSPLREGAGENDGHNLIYRDPKNPDIGFIVELKRLPRKEIEPDQENQRENTDENETDM